MLRPCSWHYHLELSGALKWSLYHSQWITKSFPDLKWDPECATWTQYVFRNTEASVEVGYLKNFLVLQSCEPSLSTKQSLKRFVFGGDMIRPESIPTKCTSQFGKGLKMIPIEKLKIYSICTIVYTSIVHLCGRGWDEASSSNRGCHCGACEMWAGGLAPKKPKRKRGQLARPCSCDELWYIFNIFGWEFLTLRSSGLNTRDRRRLLA